MILPGVTRDSVLTLARDHAAGAHRVPGLPEHLVVSERGVNMAEVKAAAHAGTLLELFGTGASFSFFIEGVRIERKCRDGGGDQPGGPDWVFGRGCVDTDGRGRDGPGVPPSVEGDCGPADGHDRERLERGGD